MKPDIRLLIGMPSLGTMCTDTALCLAFMVAHLSTVGMKGVNGHIWSICNVKGSILSRSRQQIVKAALEQDFTHLLFVDSDMHFPPDTAHRLIAHKKDIVACNCTTRGFPCNPTARLEGGEAGEMVDSVKGVGLQKVWQVGTGVVLISTAALRQLKNPLFPVYWSEEKQDYIGEDWAFFEQVRSKGIPIYVDHGLSKEIGHIGSYTFRHEDIGNVKGC